MKYGRLVAALAALPPTIVTVPTCVAGKPLPHPDHVVVVVLENHSFSQITVSDRAPFIHGLSISGALFVNSFAVAHPSQPNYFALFSGSTQGVGDNADHDFAAPTLAGSLAAAGKSFVGYVEAGSPRKHNPWESFVNAAATEQDFDQFPNDFTRLPTISFVIPNLDHDMHDGSIRQGDDWLKTHFGGYAEWAKTHNSLLIVTFDEDDGNARNHIPTIIVGARVRAGAYTERISHYSVLGTLLALYKLAPIAEAAGVPPICAIWDQSRDRRISAIEAGEQASCDGPRASGSKRHTVASHHRPEVRSRSKTASVTRRGSR